MLVVIISSLLLLVFLVYAAALAYVQWKGRSRFNTTTIGFFHPFCNAGGGGERVLWCAVQAVQIAFPNHHVVVYSGDIDVDKATILATAHDRFGITLNASKLSFVFMTKRAWVEAEHYPHFTMLMQSVGSIVLGFEAVTAHVPDVFIDTMGYAFTLPLFRLLGLCKVACYVHYPTISTDMLGKVMNRTADFNNSNAVSQSRTLSFGKLLYYRAFALAYGLAGSFAAVVMVNSSWTQNHIKLIWSLFSSINPKIVYPPCDTVSLRKLPLQPREKLIVSVAQFRPEKNHILQVSSFAQLLLQHPELRGHVDLLSVLFISRGIGQARHDWGLSK